MGKEHDASHLAARLPADANYQMLFDCMLEGFALHEMIFDAQGRPADYRFLAVNPAFEQMTGLAAKDLIGKTALDVLPGTEPFWIETYGRVVRTGEPYRFEQYSAALKRHFRVVAFRPQPGQFACLIEEITKRKEAEESLRLYMEEIHDLYDNAPCGYHSLDPTGAYVRVNKTELEWLQYRREEIIGKMRFADLLTPASRLASSENFATLKAYGSVSDVAYEMVRKDGTILPVLFTATAVKDAQGNFLMSRSMIFDITERKRMEEAIHALSLVDDLTGLYNRRGFMTLAEQQLKIANRAKRDMYLLFGDMDNLKITNDKYGHTVGDALICEMARLLRATYRESDIIARIGGDEFVVLMLDAEGTDRGELAQRLQDQLEKFSRNQPGPAPSMSVGMVRYQGNSPCSLDDLLRRADNSMYEEKRRRRNARA